MYESNHFNITFIGESEDYRTNKWRFKCKNCNKTFEPPTTILAIQAVTCPKCDNTETINYNKLK